MIPLHHGLILAAVLFILGFTCLVIRRNLLFMLIGLEVMINAGGSGVCRRRQLLEPAGRTGDVYPGHQSGGGWKQVSGWHCCCNCIVSVRIWILIKSV